jgi:predicted nuclease of predicted toxin-antitoxin system
VRFLVDNQLPVALARFLRGQGHQADHVLDTGNDEASDREIWEIARSDGAWLVTKDEDFFHLANRPGERGKLIWVRLGNCRNPALLARIEAELDAILAAGEAGHRVVEIR